jgi:hypothetical protein
MSLGLRIKSMMRQLAHQQGLTVTESRLDDQAVLERLKVGDHDASTVRKLKAEITKVGPASYFGV